MTNKSLISKKFLELGFNLVGFSKASIPKSDKDNINSWIQNKYYGQMNWFPKNNELRTEFKNLGFTPNSIIALGLVYNTKEYSKVTANFNFKFSRYAVGKDYHDVLREKAKPGLKYLKENFPNNHFRQGVDSLPVPEKILAREAGIGWIGKNTNLIHPELGSFFFLSIILTDLQIIEDSPIKDKCGSCRICIDSCPTGALFEEYKIDAGKCISHHSIEDKRDELPEKIQKEMKDWIYGCDICQSVCPWNKKSEKWERFSKESDFEPNRIFQKSEKEFLEISPEEFLNWEKESAVSRLKYETFKRNIKIYLQNKSSER